MGNLDLIQEGNLFLPIISKVAGGLWTADKYINN